MVMTASCAHTLPQKTVTIAATAIENRVRMRCFLFTCRVAGTLLRLQWIDHRACYMEVGGAWQLCRRPCHGPCRCYAHRIDRCAQIRPRCAPARGALSGAHGGSYLLCAPWGASFERVAAKAAQPWLQKLTIRVWMCKLI